MPTKSLDNPLDTEAASEKGINTPALVFFPDSASASIGSTVSMEVYVMGVEKLGMAYIKVNYDDSRLSLSTINPGDFLQGSQNLFLYDDSVAGVIDIYTSFLGPDSSQSLAQEIWLTWYFKPKHQAYLKSPIHQTLNLQIAMIIPFKSGDLGKG